MVQTGKKTPEKDTKIANTVLEKNRLWWSVPNFKTKALAGRSQKEINTKTIGNGKRDCAWGCAWGINTTWGNLQIEKHKSVRWAERTPSWFVLFDLQIFSGGVYSPSATSRTISFSISNSFWYLFDSFFRFFRRERRTVQPEIRSFALLLRSPVNHAIWQCEECEPFEKCKESHSRKARFLSSVNIKSHSSA